MKPKHQRLIFIVTSVVFLCMSALFILQAFRSNIVFFYSPSDLEHASITEGQTIRVGGLVEAGSIERGKDDHIGFRIGDGSAVITVRYQGMLPNLFRENQGVIAEGHLQADHTLNATRILAKHDEKYMPKEVVDALKRSGRWREYETKSAP